MDKLDIVVGLVDDVKGVQKEQNKQLNRIENDIRRNTDDLIDHMENNKLLKKLHLDNQKRIERIEKPLDLLTYLGKGVIILGSIAGAIYGIIRLMEKINV